MRTRTGLSTVVLGLAFVAGTDAESALRRKRQVLAIDDLLESEHRALATGGHDGGYEGGPTDKKPKKSEKKDSEKGEKSSKASKSEKKDSGKGDKNSKSGKSDKSAKSSKSGNGDKKSAKKEDGSKKDKKYGVESMGDMFAEILYGFSMSIMGSMSMSMPPPRPTPPSPTMAPVVSTSPVATVMPVETVMPAVPTLAPSVLAPTSGCSSLPRDEAIQNILLEVTDGALLSDPLTPQGQAYRFLVDSDPAQIDPCTYPAVEQRYAAATLYYSTGGSSWLNQDGWMSGADECSWFGVECVDGAVSTISLCKL
jgi:hypothetical protein